MIKRRIIEWMFLVVSITSMIAAIYFWNSRKQDAILFLGFAFGAAYIFWKKHIENKSFKMDAD